MAEKCYRSEMVGLFGCPVDENPTVVIIEAAFKALGLNYRYNTTYVRPEDLHDAVKALKAFNMKGTHITIPHKVAVLKYLDFIADDAKLMGAVNTIYLKDGKTYGENTDGKGFILSMEQANIAMREKNVVMIGAGGAARAIAVELAGQGIGKITIVNRTKKAGEALAELLCENTDTKAMFAPFIKGYNIPKDTDILINATSIGLYPDKSKPDINYQSLSANMAVCDVIPNPPQTAFLDAAKAQGCRTFDGFSMLVNQAVISFKFWTGRDAPIDVMRDALSKEFGVDV
jgi:shikimate dehydrogenase